MTDGEYVSKPTEHRYDFVFLFDVRDGNPNGDPDAGNMPRTDPMNQHGLVTDVCLKRKIRDYVALNKAGQAGYELFVEHRGILANKQRRAIAEAQGKPEDQAEASNKESKDGKAKACELYYDVRTFGAVMTTGKAPKKEGEKTQSLWNCGQVRGPVQLTFARSLHEINPLDNGITRVALTNPGDVRGGEEDEEEARAGQMGRKFTVSYGLYRGFGFVNPALAEETGFSGSDLDLLWESLVNMFQHDRSASRGLMSCVELFVFEHSNRLGNYHADRLFEKIKIEKESSGPWVGAYPSDRSCYRVSPETALPETILLWRWDFDQAKLVRVGSDSQGESPQ